MKQYLPLIICIFTFTSLTSAGASLDPWGNRKKAEQFKAQRDALVAQQQSQLKKLKSLQSELKTDSESLQSLTSEFAAKRKVLSEQANKDNVQLEGLLENLKQQLTTCQLLKSNAEVLAHQVESLETSLLDMRSGSQSLQILQSIFDNSAYSKNLWMKAIARAEKRAATDAQRRDLNLLKAAIESRNIAKSAQLLQGYSKSMMNFDQTITPSFLQNLKDVSNGMLADLMTEEALLTQINESLQSLKNEHDKIVQALR